MNAVEIEQALSDLAEQPSSTFDAAEFPFAFLAAFGNKETTIKRLRAGNNNTSDVPGGVLQRGNIHVATCGHGTVGETLTALRNSAATAKAKAKYILATDGHTAEAEYLPTFETIACDYPKLPEHLGFFLALAGISTIQEIKDNPIDVRATGRLNKLYVELLRDNPGWAGDARRADMNHFMARLIFCFFAEDTDIFNGEGLFTRTISQFTDASSANTHEVMGEIFRAMNTQPAERAAGNFRPWADQFPYVNGGLFSGNTEVPRFSRIARTYLLHAGSLQWRQINPDIFGSMIQAVADEGERGALGMHYTSVPNILKVLNPLFLDDLRAQCDAAGDNKAKLGNLRKRMARIRVFDPACGSGNFLVIAYKQMRAIEAAINQRRGEPDRRSDIPLTNFRGIELRSFPAEIARLALIIAEYQCDVQYRGQKEALAEFLPLDAQNWIVCGNALRLDWLGICPPTGAGVKVMSDDLFETPLDQTEMDFENEGGETFICGNPPYKGSQGQTDEQKADLKSVFDAYTKNWKSLDYVAGWFFKAAQYGQSSTTATAFVSTNSICQGRQVATLWPLILASDHKITFAHTSFKWANLASHNAGVTVAVVGISRSPPTTRKIFSTADDGTLAVKEVAHINAYLVPGADVSVEAQAQPLADVNSMSFGNMANDGGHLILDLQEANEAIDRHGVPAHFIRPFLGSEEFIRGKERRCIWVADAERADAFRNTWLNQRFEGVRRQRAASNRETTQTLAHQPYRFGEVRQSGGETAIIVPSVSSESREYLPVGFEPAGTIVSNLAFGLYDAPLWNLALIASRLHLVWIATVCGKLKTDFRYSNTLGWNTFPVPLLTEQMKADLTECAQNILLAREAHFPATIADLYDPEAMPNSLRAAHARNDEVLERIYIGRRFKNDTERLEKLFDLYTKMTAEQKAKPKARAKGGKP
ncbi:DNA methyltransferase [Ottowia sp.]|jgi:hypothetical protein|uniref:class I SAM-dependent DNA methyltransferase n=1 Tax=Ottowia sp. TaxID=1898956 RepID=UPI0025D80545|nr:DNA methyltransferase [Ottowia sp.]MBK6614003.1 class I SAM-dependent DNA methyltransferase [Ottowia sp.]